MSYTYLLGQGEESSAASFSDIPPSVLSRLNPTAAEFCSNGNETECCHNFRSGTTCEPLTAHLGEGALTSLQGDSPVKTSRGHGEEKDSKENAQGCGSKCTASSKKCSPGTPSSKTSETSDPVVSIPFDPCFPTSDTDQQMETSTPAIAEHHTYASGHSFSQNGIGRKWCSRVTAKSAHCAASQSARVAESIIRSALALDSRKRDGDWKTKIGDLLPTPTAQDAKNNAGPAQYQRNTWPLNVIAGGSLNPAWVEWLMGWPHGWTNCAPLATDKYQRWLRLHGKL